MASWETELLFQVFAQTRARALFDGLDPHLEPDLYIVALRTSGRGAKESIRVAILPESPGVDEAALGAQVAALVAPPELDPDLTGTSVQALSTDSDVLAEATSTGSGGAR